MNNNVENVLCSSLCHYIVGYFRNIYRIGVRHEQYGPLFQDTKNKKKKKEADVTLDDGSET